MSSTRWIVCTRDLGCVSWLFVPVRFDPVLVLFIIRPPCGSDQSVSLYNRSDFNSTPLVSISQAWIIIVVSPFTTVPCTERPAYRNVYENIHDLSGKLPVEKIRQSNLVHPYLVTLEAHDDPQNMSALRRWIAVLLRSAQGLFACIFCGE